MSIDAILLIINQHIADSKPSAAKALAAVHSEIEAQLQAERDLLDKKTGYCKLCKKEFSNLKQGLYCSLCFDMYID